MVAMKGAYRILVGEPERRKSLGRSLKGGRIILKWILSK
jgi:hypothetical protein